MHSATTCGHGENDDGQDVGGDDLSPQRGASGHVIACGGGYARKRICAGMAGNGGAPGWVSGCGVELAGGTLGTSCSMQLPNTADTEWSVTCDV
jgi:hypothetical protein